MDNIILKNLAQEMLRTIAQFRRSCSQQPFPLHGIKPSEFELLYLLLNQTVYDSTGMKVTEISEKLQITPSGVTHTINSLEKGGYIERQADPADRRIVLIKVTAKSKEIMEQIIAERVDFLEGLVTFLGEQDSEEFIRLLSAGLDYFKERKRNNADKSKT